MFDEIIQNQIAHQEIITSGGAEMEIFHQFH